MFLAFLLPPPQLIIPYSANPGDNLHVSGLSYKLATRDLEGACVKIGRVKRALVMYDPYTGDSRGFGSVTVRLCGLLL
jgi:transformer-2 protein